MRIEHPSSSPADLRGSSAIGTTAACAPAFRTVVIDLESALPSIEWASWLARRRGDIVQRRVAELAADGQRGTVAPADLYREQVALIRPRKTDLDALAAEYVARLSHETASAVRRLKAQGKRVVLVSTAPRYALMRVGARLELDFADVHGSDVRFDALGACVGFEVSAPFAQADGKGTVLAHLDLEPPTLVAQSFAQLVSLADA